MSDSLDKYWEILVLAEDYVTDRYRKKHAVPELGFPEAPRESAVKHGSSGLSPEERMAALEDIASRVASCTFCGLHKTRTNTVPGYGVLDPQVMCIGEAPGRDEDVSGNPFVGKAGQYLDKWLAAIELDRHTHCFIGNILKCRPPQNRDPAPAESGACLPYLERQIELIRPKTILTLGRISTQILLNTTEGLGSLRKRVYTFKNIPLVPTYHPSAVLRNRDLRRAVWEDLNRLKDLF
jgi:uracil-DNA glycosylase